MSTTSGFGKAATSPTETEKSLGELVQDATTDLSTLIRGELELAKLELKSSAINGGVGTGLFILAGVFVIFASIFGFIALAEGLVALHIWRWAAYLIVFGVLIFTAILVTLIGWKLVKKVRPPKKTIATTKETVAYLRDSGSRA